ncbi:GldG family protein, partial [Bacteroidota bacterium]
MKNKTTFGTYLLLVAGVLILLNILSDRFFVRLDLTEDDRYTLSRATKDILKNLDEPVTVTAYFSENIPANFSKIKRDFKEMLVEYSNISKGMLVYEFIDPLKDPLTEQKAQQAGIAPRTIGIREKDQQQQIKVYIGAVISMGEQSDVIPFIPPGAAMEYSLSSSIKKVSIIEKPLIGFLQGHGEPGLAAMGEVMDKMQGLYQVEPFELTDTVDNISKYSTIAIVAPTDSFPQSHLNQIDSYVGKGGRIFMALNRVTGEFQQQPPGGVEITTGLESWLRSKGLELMNNFIIDSNCGSISVRQQQTGGFSFTTQIQFPFLPIIRKFNEHSITKGMEQVIFQFASQINYVGDTTLNFVPLITSSEKSASLPSFTTFNVEKRWMPADFPLSNLTMGGILSGKIAGAAESKLILIGDGDFAINGEGQAARQQAGDNISLLVNSIDWLSDDTGLIELRTKGIATRPLEQIEDGKR